MQRLWVPSLVKEGRSHCLGAKKKKQKNTQNMKQKQYCNILIKSLKMVHIKNLSHVFYQNFEKHTETLMVNDYLNCKRVSLF